MMYAISLMFVYLFFYVISFTLSNVHGSEEAAVHDICQVYFNLRQLCPVSLRGWSEF